MKSIYPTWTVLLSVLISFSACQDKEESQAGAMTAVAQFEQGETLYRTYCAACHETDNGIGPKLTPEVLATRVNAQLLFNYNQRNMPYEAGNTLKEEEYWAITAFLAIRAGAMDSTNVLSLENAAEIKL